MKFFLILALILLSNNVFAGIPTAAGKREARFVDNRKRLLKPRNGNSEQVKEVSLGLPQYGGTGCPQNTASVTLSEDKKTLSVIFDNFITEAGRGMDARNSRTDCKMVIPFKVPPGYRMSVAQLDYRGFNSLPARARATFWAFHQIKAPGFIGEEVTSQQRFQGPLDDEFFVSATIENAAAPGRGLIRGIASRVAACRGGVMDLAIETTVFVQTNAEGEQTLMSLDSIDANVREGVNFHLNWEKCR